MIKIDYKMSVSTWILIVTAVGWLGWDIYAYITEVPTLSTELTRLSFYTPALPLVVGILLGHWFWPASIER